MSLDIWGKISVKECICPNCGFDYTETQDVFDLNITSNLREMANQSGCGILWDYSISEKNAWELIPTIQKAIERIKESPATYNLYSNANGWGTREQFVDFLEKLLRSLKQYPHATIYISK